MYSQLKNSELKVKDWLSTLKAERTQGQLGQPRDQTVCRATESGWLRKIRASYITNHIHVCSNNTTINNLRIMHI